MIIKVSEWKLKKGENVGKLKAIDREILLKLDNSVNAF